MRLSYIEVLWVADDVSYSESTLRSFGLHLFPFTLVRRKSLSGAMNRFKIPNDHLDKYH